MLNSNTNIDSSKFNSFREEIESDLRNLKKHNKRTVEKLAMSYSITNKNIVKETTELAIVKVARSIANQSIDYYSNFLDIVDLYKNQVNLSHRTSQSMLLQQYSTPAPISYVASLYVLKGENKEQDYFAPNNFNYNEEGNLVSSFKGKKRKDYFAPKGYSFNNKGEIKKGSFDNVHYFEPSAGNGLLTIALPMQNTIVNEIDDIRLKNLRTQNFERVTNQDATIPFTEYRKKFDGVVTNPPFGTILDAVNYDGFKIKTLDHLMALRTLDTMRDDGKASIIIGGHTNWDDKGRIQAGKNRLFFNYLYSHYNVEDVILIDGHKLFSRQGTAFNTRLILIEGRKPQIGGFAPLKNDEFATIVSDFGDLWNRVFGVRNKKARQILKKVSKKTRRKVGKYADDLVSKNKNLALDKQKRIRIAKAKAIAKLKLLNFASLNGVQTNVLSVRNEYANVPNNKIQKVAEKFYTDNIQGNKVVNLDQSIEIIFIRKGKKKSTRGRHVRSRLIPLDRILATAINHLLELTENAKFSGSNIRLKQSHREIGGIKWWNFYAKIIIDNKLYALSIPVLEIRKSPNGYKFQYSIDYADIKKILAQDRPL